MLYRMRIYRAVPENLPAFHRFFADWLLPVQQRRGARLVGRWETEDSRVVAVWEYDDRAAHDRIQAAVTADPDVWAAQEHRRTLPELFSEQGRGLHAVDHTAHRGVTRPRAQADTVRLGPRPLLVSSRCLSSLTDADPRLTAW
jgi:hypothetical protein